MEHSSSENVHFYSLSSWHLSSIYNWPLDWSRKKTWSGLHLFDGNLKRFTWPQFKQLITTVSSLRLSGMKKRKDEEYRAKHSAVIGNRSYYVWLALWTFDRAHIWPCIACTSHIWSLKFLNWKTKRFGKFRTNGELKEMASFTAWRASCARAVLQSGGSGERVRCCGTQSSWFWTTSSMKPRRVERYQWKNTTRSPYLAQELDGLCRYGVGWTSGKLIFARSWLVHRLARLARHRAHFDSIYLQLLWANKQKDGGQFQKVDGTTTRTN